MPQQLTSNVVAALTATERRWSFRYERLDKDATTVLGELDVEACSVADNALADKSKRTCSVKLAPGEAFDQLDELFRPYVRLQLADSTWAEWLLGTFLLSTGGTRSASRAGDSGQSFSGYDRLLELDEDKSTVRWVEPAGANVVAAASLHLTNRGLLPTITPSTKTLPAAMEWEPGTPILKIVNDLLTTIGYTTLSADEYGNPVAAPYVDPGSADVVWEYAVDPSSVILPGIDTNVDLFNVPNVFVAYVSEPDRPTLRSTYTNNNPASPTSTVNRGRSIVEVVQLSQSSGDAPPVDQTTLDERVLRMAQEASQIYEDVEFSTGLMPFHTSGDVFTLDNGTTGAIRYREHTWEMELKAGGTMKHRMRRVVTL